MNTWVLFLYCDFNNVRKAWLSKLESKECHSKSLQFIHDGCQLRGL